MEKFGQQDNQNKKAEALFASAFILGSAIKLG